MKERIKKLRKVLDLTQQEFADRLGISRGNIATYETREGSPGSSVISLICREFNVSETWLRTGEGEMFVPSPNGALDALAQKYGLSGRGKIIVERFLALKPDIQEAVADYIEEVAAAFDGDAPASPAGTDIPVLPALDTIGQERTGPDLAAELAELKRQNQELAAEVAAMKEEDALLGLTDAFSASPSASAGSVSPVERVKK